MSAEDINAIITADPEGPLGCLNTLLGDGFTDQLAAAIMACIDEDAVKLLIVDCLTDPTTNPITKEFLAEVIQGVDLDNDGLVGRAASAEEVEAGNAVATSEGVQRAVVAARFKKVAAEEKTRAV